MSNTGYRKKQIDWQNVEKLMSYHLTQKDVAHYYDISVDALEKYCLEDNGILLSDFWSKKKSIGRVKLRNIQFDIAQSRGPGAATMAIFLDKKLFPEDHLPPPPENPQPTADVCAIGSGKLTFNEFCNKAGYFTPYPKQNEMRSFCFEETITRLLLGARGYGKTDFCTIMGTAYDLYLAYTSGFDLDQHTTLIITKSKSRNTAIVNEIAEALQKNGVKLDKANASVIRVAGLIGQDHSVEAITIKSSMRGRHPKRIIMDDPVTDEDVSEAMRTLVKRKYNEAMKLSSNVCIIGQPAHQHDLYSELRGIVKTLEVPHGTIPELDADLEAMIIAGVDKDTIEMSYKLRVPVSGSAAFANIKYIDQMPAGDAVAFIDPSDGNNHTSVTILKGYFSGVAVQGYTWKKAWYHTLDDMIPLLVKAGVRKLCFETNKHGAQPLDQLRAIPLIKENKIIIEGAYSDTNKHACIMAAGSWAHLIHLSKQSDPTYTKLVVQYEYGAKIDDPPDSLARCMEWCGLIKGKG